MTLAADPGFPLLLRRLERERLPALDLYKQKCLQRRLAVRMRACGSRSLSDYVAVLESQPGEVDRLRRALTVNVTQFFRNPSVWARLSAGLSPEWWNGTGTGTAWSAGCATGEEAFTLAMVLTDSAAALPEPRRPAVRVDATDVDPECLATAARGCYPERALTDAPADARDRWTVREDRQWRVVPDLMARVRFLAHDLGHDPAPGGPYDVIACRNVLIYFERATQERVLARLVSALRPGGWLLLGKVETVVGPARQDVEAVDGRERLFRRKA